MGSERARAATGRGWARKRPPVGGGRALPVLVHGRSYARFPERITRERYDAPWCAAAPESGIVTRVFLDACVLYPPLVRALVLGAAEAGLYAPLWSARVLDEWRIAVASKRGLAAEGEAIAAQAAMAAAFPDARVEPGPAAEAAIRLPDPADTHVLAAAVAGGAALLLTFNLRDFPRRALSAHGIEARHPDGFLWECLSLNPERMAPVANSALAAAGIAPDRARAALKRAHLPRFGKAVAGAGAGG